MSWSDAARAAALEARRKIGAPPAPAWSATRTKFSRQR